MYNLNYLIKIQNDLFILQNIADKWWKTICCNFPLDAFLLIILLILLLKI